MMCQNEMCNLTITKEGNQKCVKKMAKRIAFERIVFDEL
jgi:hypothetical protein